MTPEEEATLRRRAAPPTHDTPEAALAAALEEAMTDHWDGSNKEIATAILAALPPGWCGHEDTATFTHWVELEAEIARLRERIAELETPKMDRGSTCSYCGGFVPINQSHTCSTGPAWKSQP